MGCIQFQFQISNSWVQGKSICWIGRGRTASADGSSAGINEGNISGETCYLLEVFQDVLSSGNNVQECHDIEDRVLQEHSILRQEDFFRSILKPSSDL